jgi:hypothetical protein
MTPPHRKFKKNAPDWYEEMYERQHKAHSSRRNRVKHGIAPRHQPVQVRQQPCCPTAVGVLYPRPLPAPSEVVPAACPCETPDGEEATMRRRVLREYVWMNPLEAAGFTAVAVSMLPASGEGPRSADTLPISAFTHLPRRTRDRPSGAVNRMACNDQPI